MTHILGMGAFQGFPGFASASVVGPFWLRSCVVFSRFLERPGPKGWGGKPTAPWLTVVTAPSINHEPFENLETDGRLMVD